MQLYLKFHVLSISCSLNLWTKSQAIENNLFVVSPCHGRPQMGTKREIETENQDFLENMKLATQFQSAGLIFAMPVYLPVWHSHCLRTRFTFLVSCSSELAVHSCPLLCVAKFGSNFSGVGLYFCCVTISWQQIFTGSPQVTMVDVLLLNTGATPSDF